MISTLPLERTERRFEVKISVQGLPELFETIGRFIPVREYVPGRMVTDNSTIYFDNNDCSLLRQGLENRLDHIRVRVRKYEYDDADDGHSDYWLELKLRQGDLRRKERIRLASNDLRGLLRGSPVTPQVCQYNAPHLREEACRALYEQLQDIVEENALKPILLASYRRVAFENATERLSVDWNIRYRLAGRYLFGYPSLKDIPNGPAGDEDIVVMELKYTGKLPSWMEDLQRHVPIHPLPAFSKCDRGMKALLQGPLSTRQDAEELLQMMHSHQHEGATTARLGQTRVAGARDV